MSAPAQDASVHAVQRCLNHLTVADPLAAQQMHSQLLHSDPSAYTHQLPRIVDEVIEALSVEITFGRTLADGMGRLLALGKPADLEIYRQRVAAAADRGPTLAGLVARHLVPILMSGDSTLVQRFEDTTRIMLTKGTYTFKAPLETLSVLIEDHDLPCAHAFLDLLDTTYGLNTSYNRTVYLTHTLPRAVAGFTPDRRVWQIQGLTRIIQIDERLADDYLQGIVAGLNLLSEAALADFIDQTVRRYRLSAEQGRRFLSLGSRQAIDRCRGLQVIVTLPMVRSALERYLLARTGLAVTIRPLAGQPGAPPKQRLDTLRVACDGRSIYLPDEIGCRRCRSDNEALYKTLVKLEAGTIEFGTYDLDVEKALDAAAVDVSANLPPAHAGRSDLDRLIACFDNANLALDLFTLFEHGRIARRVSNNYPGLHRRLHAALNREHPLPSGSLWPLYAHLVMDAPMASDADLAAALKTMADRFHHAYSPECTAETSVCLVIDAYPLMAAISDYRPLRLPFGRRLDPTGFAPFHSNYHHLASDIRSRLAQCQMPIYRSDIHKLLIRRNGQVTTDEILQLAPPVAAPTGTRSGNPPDLEPLLCSYGLGEAHDAGDGANTFRYREWDGCMGDYLPDRVRVTEHESVPADETIYQEVLDTYRGMVSRIRYAFELLRPEEITILRQWREGDDFDYRALVDYAVDKRAGRMPSDRLFVKRMKRVRDVAALLLVDLSRSTANTLDDGKTRVVDVEKQAIVLLCEALTVVGDRFAIAGFSGTGPLGVDFYRIKDFGDSVNKQVKGRIAAIRPHRSTRMGAAIRHATSLLSAVDARVKLMIVLGDGFPNDVAYKGTYAVEDTRRSIMEARTAGIHVKGITVNINDNGQLDRLYGSTHHTLIGNVRDLPDKLVRVYSALTRH